MMFSSQDSSSERDRIKQEHYTVYATPSVPSARVATQVVQYPESQIPALELRTASSINTTASSGAFGSSSGEMPQKRSSRGEVNGSPAKHVKAEHPEEFSQAVKKKLLNSTRTGQACDRCKIRKIRCDGLPGGCSPCLQNNNECRTTDRITGRATSRGYVEGLEQQTRDLQHRVRELEQRLIQSGADIKPSDDYNSGTTSNYVYGQTSPVQASSWNPTVACYTSNNYNGNAIATQQQDVNILRPVPAFRSGIPGDNFLGISPGNSNLSAIKGTALSILGMEIDIADFASMDMDEPDKSVFHPQLYNKSYQAFLQSALNINPRIEKVDLPPRDEGLTYADWYFRLINPYLPLLHRPTFFKVLTRMYDDPTFRPTTAERVMVHMVFAIMYFQYAVRNWEDAARQATLNDLSNTHYHYSLGQFYQLSCSHTVQDVQALTLICTHLRNFPKPGASWILTQTTMSLAIELGLHRSATKWVGDVIPNPLDVEMRKRTFWALLTIHVTLSGKLGRPSFRMEDFDVEMPESVDDELLTENGLDMEASKTGKCLHVIGLQAIRLVPLFMEMYSTIYAVRRSPENYISTITRLEANLRTWRDGLPADLVQGKIGVSEQEGKVFALYAQVWELEFRILLRHPAASATTDRDFNAESMRICVESSRQMLGIVRQLQKFKSLDTTWYNTAVYVMAITTTLFAQWDKRGETSTADLAALKEEMDLWLDIMGEVGSLLGSGNRLRQAVQVVTESTLSLLSRSLPGKPAGFSAINGVVKDTKLAQTKIATSSYHATPTNHNYAYPTTSPTNGTNSTSAFISTENGPLHQSTPYPAATQYSTYPETTSAITYTSPQALNTYTTYPTTTDGVDAPLLTSFAAEASHADQNQWRATHAAYSGSQAWQQWTSTMTGAGNLKPQDYYSATTLMQLGGQELAEGSSGNVNTGVNVQADVSQLDSGQLGVSVGMQWPMMFDIGPGGTGSG